MKQFLMVITNFYTSVGDTPNAFLKAKEK